MKLLHVVASYAPAWQYGGPIRSVAALCEGLARLGEDVTVFTTNVDGKRDLSVPVGRPVLRNGVKVYYFQARPPRYWSFSWALTQALEREVRGFDLVHLHALFGYPGLAAGHFCRRFGVPYILSPRGMLCTVAYGMKSLRKRIYLNLLERRNLRAARAIHFTSQEEELQRASLRLRPQTVVVPNSIDLEEFVPLPPFGTFRAAYPEMAGKLLLLFLGRVHRIKGLDRLVEAFSRVARSVSDVHLVIAGYDHGGYESLVRQWLRERGLLERSTFVGPLVGRDKLAAFRDCDLFVMPSYQENFGMAALEAMACGLPVVVSKGVGLYPEIQAAEAGLVVEGEPEGLAMAIETLLQDSTLRARMGKAGFRLVRERFSAEGVAERMRSVYRSSLAKTEISDSGREGNVIAPPTESRAQKTGGLSLAGVILTYNEERNLASCLESLQGLTPQVFVVDSGSTDGTVAVAERYGARAVYHSFETHPKQWNWALRNLPISSDWVLCLDADQCPTPELREEIRQVLALSTTDVDGFYLRQRYFFLGRWIRHGGHYSKYHLRLVRLRSAFCDEREYLDPRFSVKGKTAALRCDLAEYNRKDDDLATWTRKHLSHAARQALEEYRRRSGQIRGWERVPSPFGDPDQRRLWLKSVWYRLPLYSRPFLYFLYRYLFRLGFLDGKEGFIFHFLHSVWYRLMVDTEIDRLQQEAKHT